MINALNSRPRFGFSPIKLEGNTHDALANEVVSYIKGQMPQGTPSQMEPAQIPGQGKSTYVIAPNDALMGRALYELSRNSTVYPGSKQYFQGKLEAFLAKHSV